MRTLLKHTLMGLLGATLAAGCQTEKIRDPGAPIGPMKVGVRGGSMDDPIARVEPLAPAAPLAPRAAVARPRMDPDDLAGNDAGRVRLDDLRFQLLLYYASNHRLPQTLDDLRASADPGDATSLMSPSGQPYVYLPDGLQMAGEAKRLILYEPAADRSGIRQGLLMTDPQGDRPAALWVVPLTEKTLQAYIASAAK